jgi:hypothetical protein
MPYYGTGQLYYPTVLSTGTVANINYNWGGGYVLDSGRHEQVIVIFMVISPYQDQDLKQYIFIVLVMMGFI